MDEKLENAPITKLVLLSLTQVGLGDVDRLSTKRGLGFTWHPMGELHSIDLKDDHLTITITGLVYEKEMQSKGLPRTLGAFVFKRQFSASIDELKKAIETNGLDHLSSLTGEDLISRSLLMRQEGASLDELPTLVNTDKQTLTLNHEEALVILKGVEKATRSPL